MTTCVVVVNAHCELNPVPGTLLIPLVVLCHLILGTALWGRYFYYAHFIEKETANPEKIPNFPCSPSRELARSALTPRPGWLPPSFTPVLPLDGKSKMASRRVQGRGVVGKHRILGTFRLPCSSEANVFGKLSDSVKTLFTDILDVLLCSVFFLVETF